MNKKTNWWSEEYGFFGEHYLEGDDSEEGYLIAQKQDLNERTQVEVAGVVRLLDLKGNESILDIPSGYGRHSIELAKRGFKVTGIELNSIHIKKATKEATEKGVNVDFIQENMIDISYRNKFDAVINMFYSFGFFDTDNENEKVLQNFYNSLKPGGTLLFLTDVNIPRILSGKYREDEVRRLKSGKTLRIIDKYNSEDKRIYGTWIIKDAQSSEIKKDYVVRVYTQEEFIDMCTRVGFKHFETYSDWNKGPYSKNSEDMIIVAHK